MDLNELLVFVRVVQAGSIRGAAELLGMPKSTVSRKLVELEGRLEARLLQRTTRKLGLTDTGRLYYGHALRVISEIENAEHAVRSQREVPRGTLRISAPLNLGFLAPLVSDYLQRYPQVRIEMVATARVVDLIEECFDLGIRGGRLEDSSLVARPLGVIEWRLVATSSYLDRRGRPRSPAELKEHDCLLFGSNPTLALQREGESQAIPLTPRLLVTDIDVVHNALKESLGIAVMPAFMCAKALQASGLEPVLPEWRPPALPINIVFPSARHLSPTVRSFIDHIAERITEVLLGACPSTT